jgi:uncharacterized protein (TIGR02145 family)
MKSIFINNQVWAEKNLDILFFRNGDSILEAQGRDEWEQAAESKTPAWCYYNQQEFNGDFHGVLYNWHAVSDPRGLAPEGWKIPAIEHWEQMADFLGDGQALRLRTNEMWREDDFMPALFKQDYDEEAKGEENTDENINSIFNSTGFDAQPSGARGRLGNAFYAIGDSAYWWTSSEDSDEEAYFVLLYVNYDNLQIGGSTDKRAGHAVRCIRDNK